MPIRKLYKELIADGHLSSTENKIGMLEEMSVNEIVQAVVDDLATTFNQTGFEHIAANDHAIAILLLIVRTNEYYGELTDATVLLNLVIDFFHFNFANTKDIDINIHILTRLSELLRVVANIFYRVSSKPSISPTSFKAFSERCISIISIYKKYSYSELEARDLLLPILRVLFYLSYYDIFSSSDSLELFDMLNTLLESFIPINSKPVILMEVFKSIAMLIHPHRNDGWKASIYISDMLKNTLKYLNSTYMDSNLAILIIQTILLLGTDSLNEILVYDETSHSYLLSKIHYKRGDAKYIGNQTLEIILLFLYDSLMCLKNGETYRQGNSVIMLNILIEIIDANDKVRRLLRKMIFPGAPNKTSEYKDLFFWCVYHCIDPELKIQLEEFSFKLLGSNNRRVVNIFGFELSAGILYRKGNDLSNHATLGSLPPDNEAQSSDVGQEHTTNSLSKGLDKNKDGVLGLDSGKPIAATEDQFWDMYSKLYKLEKDGYVKLVRNDE